MYEKCCEKAGLTETKNFIRWVDGKKFVQKCIYDQNRKCGANCTCFNIDRGTKVLIFLGCCGMQYKISNINFEENIRGIL
jgi:hypothetical protein